MDRHFTSIADIKDRNEAEKLFRLADKIRLNKQCFRNALRDKQVATLFYEPSTRTRLSFESAVQQLGAQVLSTENAGVFSSAIKGESLEDTINVVAGYADAIVLRHSDNNSAVRAAKVSDIPVICAGAGTLHHPTQAVLDVYTLRELKGKIDNLNIAVTGDLKNGRTIHSLVELLALYDNIKVHGYAPAGLDMPDEHLKFMADRGIQYSMCETFRDIPKDADAIYSTRIQRERMESSDNFREDDYRIDAKRLSKFSGNTLIMHPLPRNSELSTDIDSDPRAVYFHQAHNGVPTRKAVLLSLMGRDKI